MVTAVMGLMGPAQSWAWSPIPCRSRHGWWWKRIAFNHESGGIST